MSNPEIINEGTADVVCPWCGHLTDPLEFAGPWRPSLTACCLKCDKLFTIRRVVIATYSTVKIVK